MQTFIMPRIVRAALVLAAGALLGASMPAQNAAAADNDAKLIRIGVQQGLSGATPLKYVKWIEEQGYKVQWTTFQNAGASSTALVAGSIDMQAAGLAPEMALATKDPDIWLVGTSELNSSQLVVAPKSGITRIADLKGKTISTAGPGSQQYALLVAALKKEGMTVRDLRLISTPASTMPALLEKGAIDGFFAWPPFTSKVLQAGKGKLLISATPEFHASIGGKGPWVGEGWEVNAKFARAHKDAVEAVLRAEMRYFKLLHDSPAKGYELMAKAAHVEAAHVAYIIEQGYDAYPVDITPDRAVIGSMLDLIMDAGLVSQADKLDKEKFIANFIHPEFVKAVESK
jgi:ABC-type nitrate/sulfonate/bicarbonate transport system substrate-binding protein